MRKHLYILCLLSLVTHRVALAADSAITIIGTVNGNTCFVSSGSSDFTVSLMSNSSKLLYQPGAVTPLVPFSIVFDQCGSSATGVKVGFTGPADNNNTSLLKINGGGGAAAGVGIQILDNNKNAIDLNSAQSALDWSPLTGNQSNTLYFYARLMATLSPVTAGAVNATADFTLEFQ